jgi:hypothetical protein
MSGFLPQALLIGGATLWGLGWLPLQFFAAQGLTGMPLVLLTYSLRRCSGTSAGAGRRSTCT